MTLAYMSYLSEYWWLLLTFVFGVVMFGGRKLDFIMDWFAERKMNRLYPKLTERYEDEILNQDKYLSELLGVHIRLEDLMERVCEINKKLTHNEMERVTYLELWIIAKLYGKHLSKSDNHIYYVNSKYFIYDLELSFKNLNFWALEFANSKEIKEMRIGATFTLHRIRTKDPSCNPNSALGSSQIAGAVFERDYLFSSKAVSSGTIGDLKGTFTYGEYVYESNDTGWHCLGKKDELTINEKIGSMVTIEKKKQAASEEVKKEETIKAENKKVKEEEAGYQGNKNITLEEVTEDGSQKLVDNKGRKHTIKSDIGALEKSVNQETKEKKDFEADELSKKPFLHAEQEKSLMSENKEEVDMMKIICLNTKKSSRGKSSIVEKAAKKTEPKNERSKKPKTEKPKNENPNKTFTKKSMSVFLEELPEYTSLFNEFLSKEKNEIYYCEEKKRFYISLTHMMKFLDETAVEKDEFASSIFCGPKFNQGVFNEIIDGLGKSIGDGTKIENIKRRSFHRADEGYKEIYTFGEVSGIDVLERYPEKITRGLMSDKYNRAKFKAFVENYKDL